MGAMIFNKQILLAVGMIVFAAAVIVQGTGAFFTDTETSTASTFTTGTLELDINENGLGDEFNLGLGSVNLNPGEVTGEAQLRIKNGGSVNLGWFGYFNTSGADAMLDAVYIDSAMMEFRKIGSSDWESADQFILNGDGNVGGAGGHPWNTYFQTLADSIVNDDKVSLREFNTANNMMGTGDGVFAGALKPGGYEYRLTFTLGMLEDVPNSLQGKSLNLSYTITSTQVSDAAIASLDAGNTRVSVGAPAAIESWMNDQLAKQH